MNESSCENVPWLIQKTEDSRTTVTATVIEGAEVVRTAAVSYATPILHQVFIQGTPTPRDENSITTVANSAPDFKAFRLSIAQPPPAHTNGLLIKNDNNAEKDLKAPTSSSVPLLVFPSSILSSNSVVLKPVTTPPKEGVATHLSAPSLASFASSPAFSPFSSFNGSIRTDDELTPLTWLHDSNVLMGTALSPIRHSQIVTKPPEPLIASPPSPEPKGVPKTPSSGVRKGDPAPVGKLEDVKGTIEVVSERVDDVVVDCKVESPTSDYAEDNHSDGSGDVPEAGEVNILPKTSGSSSGSATNSGSGSGSGSPSKSQQPVPYNPKVHIKAKPPFSFSCLIFMAIEESPTKALPVKDIYSWIVDHYPYYKNAPTGWKNSVRHNLSLNKCFSKVEKSSTLGKGSLWMVDPTFRPNLLHAMSKTPFVPQSSVDNNFINSKTLINTKYLYGLTSKTPEKIVTMGTFVVQNEVDVVPSTAAPLSPASASHDRRLSEETNDSTFSPVPTKPQNENHVTPINLQTSSSELGCRPGNTDEITGKIPRLGTGVYTPNPELFPRLAKRLETHTAGMGPHLGPYPAPHQGHHQGHHQGPRPVMYPQSTIEVHSEDVDAAAAMLVLKHGPRMLSPYRENFANFSANSDIVPEKCVTRNHKISESSDSGSVVISSSPSLDHAYVVHSSNRTSTCQPNFRKLSGKSNETSPTSSVDEAFFDDSFESETVWDSPVTSHSPRQYEEADALLNLAAVAASLASRDAERTSPDNDHHPTQIESQANWSSTESQIICNVNSTHRFSDSSDAKHLYTQPHSDQHVDSDRYVDQPITASPSTNNTKSTKRKLRNEVRNKLSPNKKPANYSFTRINADLANKNSPNRSLCNNNNKAVVNRNKLLKVKKILKVSRC